MASRLAVFLPAGPMVSPDRPFGRMIANQDLYAALVRHGGYERVDFLSQDAVAPAEALRRELGAGDGAAEIAAATYTSPAAATAAVRAGVLLRPDPELYDLAWERRRVSGDRGYSLAGLVHTLAPPAMRQKIALALQGPTQPWDAIICTSPSVRQVLERMLDGQADFLAERYGGSPPPRLRLPVIPLGVRAEAVRAMTDRPGARAALRAELGLAEKDVLVLWVGRLSFFEKAYPQPMFRAVQEAAQGAGRRVAFVMAGWFPNGELDHREYAEAAQAYAPDIDVRFENGTDKGRVADLWAAADVFLSLVDNIQETFGLTPVEAMAAGLPVVASDWDGYRFTIRHGQEGFLIPTLGGPVDGMGATLAAPHVQGVESYQSHVGTLAQSTAVHVGRAAQAIAELVRSPDLRRRMGAAGRARVAETFDWPVVARQFAALLAELGEIRAASGPPPPSRHRLNPVKGDPFADFAPFATETLRPETRLAVRPGVSVDDLARANTVQLDRKAGFRRAPFAQAVQAYGMIASGEARTVAQVLERFPPDARAPMELTLVWLCKLGILDWLDA